MISTIKNTAKNGERTYSVSNNKDLVESMKGSRFEQMLELNPYNNSPRKQSFWEKVLSGLGFRTNYDKDMEQLSQASAEYQAQIAQLASEDKYNSPLEQANRMRQAGLNPDLTGVTGEPASEFDNQQNSPEMSGSDQEQIMSAFQNFSSLILGTFGTAESIMQSVGTMSQLVQNIRSGSLDQAQKVVDTVGNLHGLIMGDETINKDNIEFNPNVQALLGIIPNRKMRKRVLNYLVDYEPTLQKRLDMLNTKTNVENRRKEYNSLLGSSTYSSSDETMQGLMKILSDGQFEATKAMYEAQKKQFKAEAKQSEYSANLADKLNADGTYNDEAEAYKAQQGASISDSDYRSTENAYNKEKLDIQKHILDTYKKALDFLNDQAQKGDLLSGVLSFALGSMSFDWKNMLTSSIPGYNAIKGAGKYIPQFIKRP